jgi:hypothetical protein
MASWTAVRVRERGRFWVCEVRERLERLGRGRMRREATIRTWRSENFFSSSRVRLGMLELLYIEKTDMHTAAGPCASPGEGGPGQR